jgi:DNA polymerase sigma
MPTAKERHDPSRHARHLRRERDMLERKIANSARPGVRPRSKNAQGVLSWEDRLVLINKEQRSVQAGDQPKKLLGLFRGKRRGT